MTSWPAVVTHRLALRAVIACRSTSHFAAVVVAVVGEGVFCACINALISILQGPIITFVILIKINYCTITINPAVMSHSDLCHVEIWAMSRVTEGHVELLNPIISSEKLKKRVY